SLDRVIRDLNRSQVLRVFDMPVTDLEAPNYSRTITNPMSFATMREKLARTEYRNKMQFASDIELIADNCILYNGINSVYGGYADQL
ncbi:Bromodomain-containing protein, partial [Blastocladiella britannica]